MYDTKYSWNKHINSCINNYILSGSNNYSDSYIYSYICGQSRTRSEHGSSSKQTSTNGSDLKSSNVLYVAQKYRHLWIQCENCYGLNYKKI